MLQKMEILFKYMYNMYNVKFYLVQPSFFHACTFFKSWLKIILQASSKFPKKDDKFM